MKINDIKSKSLNLFFIYSFNSKINIKRNKTVVIKAEVFKGIKKFNIKFVFPKKNNEKIGNREFVIT